MDSFRRYCYSYLAALRHPFQSSSEQLLSDDELETIVAFASYVVRHRVQEKRLQDLDLRFQSAFDQYLLTSRAEPGALSNVVERLATLLEPFLKKLVLVCYPRRKYRKQGRSPTPLWHQTMEPIIRSLGLATADLKKSEEAYWQQQTLEDANWRIAYVTRHKGAHEAHRYDIIEIERIAKAVITCYLSAARHVLRDPRSRAKTVELSSTVERLNGLLTARASTYRLTHDLPKTLEHLQLYQARRELYLDDEKRHLLFHSFLHGNGPTYFFVRHNPRDQLIKWAQELLGRTDDGATLRAIHFIHDAGGTVPLPEMVRSFRSYAHRHKLAFYINRSAENRDTAILWSLHRHKARVVQAAVANALSRRVTSRHRVLLRRVENSTSPTTRRLLLPLASTIARPRDAEKFRRILQRTTRGSVSCALVGLAKVGSSADRPLLEHWTRGAVGGRGTREIAWTSLGLHAGKQGNTAYVRRVIRHARPRALHAFLRGLSHSQSQGIVPLILGERRRLDKESIEAISRCATSQDAPTLARLLRRRGVSELTKPILLALLSFGRPADVSLVLRLIVHGKQRIDFREQYDVVFWMARAARQGVLRSQLLSLIRTKEFWKYFPVRPKQGALPVGNRENIPLLRRIVGMCFSEVASARDRRLLLKMLAHSYWPVYYGAARALSRLSGLRELDLLIDAAIHRSEEAEPIRGFLEAIHLIDRRVYGGLQAEVAPETEFGKAEN